MEKLNITKRDIKFFFLGVLTLIFIDLIINWEENKQAIIEGFNDGYNSARTEIMK